MWSKIIIIIIISIVILFPCFNGSIEMINNATIDNDHNNATRIFQTNSNETFTKRNDHWINLLGSNVKNDDIVRI